MGIKDDGKLSKMTQQLLKTSRCGERDVYPNDIDLDSLREKIQRNGMILTLFRMGGYHIYYFVSKMWGWDGASMFLYICGKDRFYPLPISKVPERFILMKIFNFRCS